MAVRPVVALEVGTSKVVALVAELRDDETLVITGMGEVHSRGVRKGEVIDFENARACVRKVLVDAEEAGDVDIREVHLAISGGHIASVVNRGSVPVVDPNGEITEDDEEAVMKVARTLNLPADRKVLHTVVKQYTIDDQEQVLRPRGFTGHKLDLDMLILHGLNSKIRNTIKVVTEAPDDQRASIEVRDTAFSGLCSALAVLSKEQKESGVLLIDVGGGTCDYIAYAAGAFAEAGTLAVGGDHITNDIALAFNLPLAQAESLKRTSGSAVIDEETTAPRITVPPEMGFGGRSIDPVSLQTVIYHRVEESFEIIRQRLAAKGLAGQFGAGVVLTGGTALLKGITEVAHDVFDAPCIIGKPRAVSGLVAASSGPQYATAIGLVRLAFRTTARSEETGVMERFRSVVRLLGGGR